MFDREEKGQSWANRCLKFAVFAVFLGTVWQLLRWDSPLRSLLWKEDWMAPLVQMFGVSWESFVTSPQVDQAIVFIGRFMGVLCMTAAAATWSLRQRPRLSRPFIGAGVLVLIVVDSLFYIGKYFQLGMLIEHSLQWSCGLFLLASAREPRWTATRIMWLKLAVSLTFIGHGLYAVGYHPRPGQFVSMIMRCLPLEESSARLFLTTAGWIDFFVAGAIWLPRIARPALLYCAFWGLLTALARPYAYFDADNLLGWSESWLHPFLIRIIHGIAPVTLWLVLQRGVSAEEAVHQPLRGEGLLLGNSA